MRLNKISLFVGGKQINYLLQPSALANKINELRDCDKSQYIVLAESIVLSFSHWNCCFFLNEYLLEAKQSAIFMQEWSQEGEKLSFMHEQNITHSQTKLGDIAPEQTIIYRQLLAGWKNAS